MDIQYIIQSTSTEEAATLINTFFLPRFGEEVAGEFVFPAKAERHAIASLISESLVTRDAGPLTVLASIIASHGTVYTAARKLRGKGGVYRSRKQLEQAQILQQAGLSDDAPVSLPFAFLSEVEKETAKEKHAKA